MEALILAKDKFHLNQCQPTSTLLLIEAAWLIAKDTKTTAKTMFNFIVPPLKFEALVSLRILGFKYFVKIFYQLCLKIFLHLRKVHKLLMFT